MATILIVILIVLLLGGGGYGWHAGYYGPIPFLGLLALIIIILALFYGPAWR